MSDDQQTVATAAQTAASVVANAAQTAANAVATAAANANVTTGTDIAYIKRDIGDIKSSLNEVRDGLVARVVSLEARQDKDDLYHASIPLKRYDEIAIWTENFRSTWKLVLGLGGFIIAILGGLIASLIRLIFHF